MIHAVRLGFGLYRLVHDEQHRKASCLRITEIFCITLLLDSLIYQSENSILVQQAEAERERKQKEEAARNQMKPASTDSENSDDELDIELKRYLKIGQTIFNDY